MQEITEEFLTLAHTHIYFRSFINFTNEDSAALHASKPILGSSQSIRTPSITPADIKDLSLEHPQIAFRKDFLKGYIVKLHRSKRPGLRVEYIHCVILLGFVEDIIISTVIAHPGLDTETKLAVSKAVNKILWIQNDLFARHYIEQTEQAQAAKERARPFHCNPAFGAAVPFVACLIGFALARFWKH
ncbi:hypothetical protein BDQ17DRAFT_1428540 [Cyathus striatus]|nr:hypothetical protein BDQ17DRAFT_1428540 [Cyathus striatus]